MRTERQRLINPVAISAALNAPRPDLKGGPAVEQMADDMRIIRTRTGGTSRDDLALIGWTQTQIDAHHIAAREMAERLSLDSAAA